jgi:hypothetical protein
MKHAIHWRWIQFLAKKTRAVFQITLAIQTRNYFGILPIDRAHVSEQTSTRPQKINLKLFDCRMTV